VVLRFAVQDAQAAAMHADAAEAAPSPATAVMQAVVALVAANALVAVGS
jgi:hypothetical protein